MEYSAATSRNNSPMKEIFGGFFLAVILFLLAVGIGLMLVNYGFSHGPTKHGDAALEVRQCLNNSGPMSVWKNPVTGREAHICDMGNRWGVQIRINDDELTAFIKEKMMRYEQVVKYLKNRGYACVTGQCG